MAEKRRRQTTGFMHSQVISIISISMVLFLIGVVTLIGLIGKGLQDYVRESMSFTVILPQETNPLEVKQMNNKLLKEPFVKEVLFHSKEEALQEVSAELGENPEDFLGWNPLSPSFEVKVKSAYVSEPDSIAKVEKALKAYPMTQSLSYKKDLLDDLNKNISLISVVMIVVAMLLLLISFVLINNTIRLLIYSKRFSIYTMRLVGATPGFIRRPFIRTNIVSGIIAAIVALAFLAWVWFYLMNQYPILGPVLTPINGYIVIGVVVLLGLVISWISAALSVNKYLRMNVNKLYRV